MAQVTIRNLNDETLAGRRCRPEGRENLFVILLRGVMPTGKNKVSMGPLRESLEKAGFRDARTYIQSGNVLARFRGSRAEAERRVRETIAKTTGGDIEVMARVARDFRRIVGRNPLKGGDAERLYYSVLKRRPDAAAAKEFRAVDFAPDAVVLLDDVVYTLYDSRASASKFNNNWFERKLGVAATTRNHNTMTNLARMTESAGRRSESTAGN